MGCVFLLVVQRPAVGIGRGSASAGRSWPLIVDGTSTVEREQGMDRTVYLSTTILPID